jgi:hypothetical protein
MELQFGGSNLLPYRNMFPVQKLVFKKIQLKQLRFNNILEVGASGRTTYTLKKSNFKAICTLRL